MRVGLISDIHGNAFALETVLAALHQEQIDRLVCLGDVAALGPQPREIVERLRLLRCPTVMGNCDVWLADWPLEDDGTESFRQVKWAAEQLSTEDFDYIRGFRDMLRAPLADRVDLLCFHGSPRSNREMILATTPEHELDDMLAGYDADVMIGGHTHLQILRRYRHTIVVNAGSVGLARDLTAPEGRFWNPPWAEYALVDYESGSLSVELRRAPLDVPSMLSAAWKTGMPCIESWTEGWQRPEVTR